MQVTARAEQDTGPAAGYPRFYAAVALAQLTSWLPGGRRFLIDISGPGARTAEVAARAGHRVLRVIDPEMPVPPPGPADEAAAGCPPWRPTGPAWSSSPTAAPTA